MALYRIADLVVELDASGRTLSQAEPYRITGSEKPDMTIRCDPRQILELNPRVATLDMAEYLSTGALFARKLLRFDGFQLHSSAVLLDGRAYLFTAPSGTGKSTHTEKWCRLFGARLLNDDKPALRYRDGTWLAYGTPWSGKHDLSMPESAPIGGIAYLRRGEENEIRRLEPAEAVPLLLSQCLRRLEAEQMERELSLLDKLLNGIPVWLLTCRNDDQAAFLSKEVMSR